MTPGESDLPESDDNKNQNTKYTIPDGHWEEKEVEENNDAHPTQYIDGHEVNIYVDDVDNPDDNYQRTKYSAHVTYRDGEPSVLYVTTHRWKGNYWRDKTDLDWKDTPEIVKQRVAAVVACDGVDDLDPGHRLVDEGGRNRWKDIHMPRIEASRRGDVRMESVETTLIDIVEDAAAELGMDSPRLEGVDVDQKSMANVTLHLSEVEDA